MVEQEKDGFAPPDFVAVSGPGEPPRGLPAPQQVVEGGGESAEQKGKLARSFTLQSSLHDDDIWP